MPKKKGLSSNELKQAVLGTAEQPAKAMKGAKGTDGQPAKVVKDAKGTDEQPAKAVNGNKETQEQLQEVKKVIPVGIKCKGPKLRWDYSQYDDYPVGPNKGVSSPSTVKDPYEGDRCLPMQLEWRIEKRGFKSSPNEKK